MDRRITIIFTLCVFVVFLVSDILARPQEEEEEVPPPEKLIQLILDASGSMNGKLEGAGGQTKLEAAKQAVKTLMEELLDQQVISFRAYGHQSPRRKKDCNDTRLLVPFSPAGEIRRQVITAAQKLVARGYTPITRVLTLAAKDFPKKGTGPVSRVIILVSDGKETCEGDPCALAASLAESGAAVTIHTVGFGVDMVTRGQLKCISNVTGGKYFDAGNTRQLAEVLSAAVKTASTEVKKEKGAGRLQVKGADLSGHIIYNAETGERIKKTISRVNTVVKIPAGIYNVTVGKAVWKSVEVKTGRLTLLEPGRLSMENPSLRGHKVVEQDSGVVHGSVSSLKSAITLMPGTYEVMFGELAWIVSIGKGEKVVLKPGTVTVKDADFRGHKIRDVYGKVVGRVSSSTNWLPLPPGEYTIEINEKKIPFSLEEGLNLSFVREKE